MVLPTSWHWVEGSRRLEDHGIKVEHVYEVMPAAVQGMSPLSPPRRHPLRWASPTVLPQLHNKGPGTVSGVTLSLAVPHRLGDHVLLYLLELGTEGGMSCPHHPTLNPAQVGTAGPLPAGGRWDVSGGWVSPLCLLPAGDLRSDGRGARERHPAAGAPGGGGAPGSRAGGRGAGGPRPCGERAALGTCRRDGGRAAGARVGPHSWVTLGTCSPWWAQGWERPLGWGPSNTHCVGRHPQDCDNATCVDITCHVPSLGKDQRALVSVHALLWMDTLQQVLSPPGDRGDEVALWPRGIPAMSPPARWSPESTLGIPCVGPWAPC